MGIFNRFHYTKNELNVREQKRRTFSIYLNDLYNNYRALQKGTNNGYGKPIMNPFTLTDEMMGDLSDKQKKQYTDMKTSHDIILGLYNDPTEASNMFTELERLLQLKPENTGKKYDFDSIKQILKTHNLVPYPTKSGTKFNRFIGTKSVKPVRSHELEGGKHHKRHYTKKRRSSSIKRKHRNISSRVRK